jgi:hypothetical protein
MPAEEYKRRNLDVPWPEPTEETIVVDTVWPEEEDELVGAAVQDGQMEADGKPSVAEKLDAIGQKLSRGTAKGVK